MAIRKSVEDFVKLGPLPNSSAAEDIIARHQIHLQRIKQPVSDEEASLLIRCFGTDECYGLAWTLLHLIESAPGGVPLQTKPIDPNNEWLNRLWERSHKRR